MGIVLTDGDKSNGVLTAEERLLAIRAAAGLEEGYVVPKKQDFSNNEQTVVKKDVPQGEWRADGKLSKDLENGLIKEFAFTPVKIDRSNLYKKYTA